MKPVFAVLTLLACTACAKGVGEPGSVLWQLTANDVERRYYGNDRLTTARLQCAHGGYSGEGYEACVRNAMKY